MKKLNAAFLVRPATPIGPEGKELDGLKRTWFAGCIIGDFPIEDDDQMWYGDFVIMEDGQPAGSAIYFAPRLVLEGNDLGGHTISQVLTSGYQNPRNWKRILVNLTGDEIEVGGE